MKKAKRGCPRSQYENFMSLGAAAGPAASPHVRLRAAPLPDQEEGPRPTQRVPAARAAAAASEGTGRDGRWGD